MPRKSKQKRQKGQKEQKEPKEQKKQKEQKEQKEQKKQKEQKEPVLAFYTGASPSGRGAIGAEQPARSYRGGATGAGNRRLFPIFFANFAF